MKMHHGVLQVESEWLKKEEYSLRTALSVIWLM